MFLPYATDAPVYHRPIGTVLVILICTLFAIGGPRDELVLVWGDGLHPEQWLASHFVHADWIHLAGNAVFLWVFGLVVEGKVGLARFLGIVVTIAVLESALEQAVMLGADGGGSLGSSSIVFGLLAISMIWAPQNSVHAFWFFHVSFYIRGGVVEITLRSLGLLYILWEGLGATLGLIGGVPTSAFLHLLGAAVGLPIGILMVKRRWVDCEGWDIFSLRDGRPKEIKLHRNRSTDPVLDDADADDASDDEPLSGLSATQIRTDALDLIESYIAEGDIETAIAIYDETVEETGPWSLSERLVLAWADAAEQAGELPLIHRVLRRAIIDRPASEVRLRLLLGRAYLELGRPISALEILESMRDSGLYDFQREERERLLAEVEAQRAAGVLELESDE